MSIQTELTRLTNAKAAIQTAIEGKGVTVPSGTLLDGMAALIESIETGGGGNSIKIDSGTFTPAENVSTYKVTPNIQIDNVVIQALMPNIDGFGLSFIPKDSAGCYFGYNIPNYPNRQVQCSFSSALYGGESLSGRTAYVHIEKFSWYEIDSSPFSDGLSNPLGVGMNGDYFKFLAGVEYLWFRIGY